MRLTKLILPLFNHCIIYKYCNEVSVQNNSISIVFGAKGWLNTVNKITGRETKALNISSVINPDDINLFFQRINTDTQYSVPELLHIPEGTRVPTLM